MRFPEDELIELMDEADINPVSTLPCERVKNLIFKINQRPIHIPLTREEEGVGISAGAALSGKRPAMIIQNSGLGNMINALLSLTHFYSLPLAVFVSQRGVYKEKIAAQIPMGKAVSRLLKALGIGYTVVGRHEELFKVRKNLNRIYEESRIHAFLMSPKIWEGSSDLTKDIKRGRFKRPLISPRAAGINRSLSPRFIRYEVIELLRSYLKDKTVVSNLGFPSKELYHLLDQPSNFYMLGSMGMATPIGLGLSLTTNRDVIVIDGDGSLLMNPGTLATVAVMAPHNLTIIAVDNGVYSSTGNQTTHTSCVTDLSTVARGFGIKNISTVSKEDDIIAAVRSRKKGPRFIHILTRPGNVTLPNIPLTSDEIRERFKSSLM